jgi:hypothetical protein
MRESLTTPPLGSAELEPNPAFNVVIVYEDLEAGKQAKKTYDYLEQKLGHECRFFTQMWKFEVLNIPKVREMAAGDLMAADIIIISCARADSLPLEMKAWFEQCLDASSKALALVFLYGDFTAPDEAPGLTEKYLAAAATRARCEFFAQSYQGSRAPNPAPSGVPGADGVVLPWLGGMPQPESYPRWGINE